jgi:hypothetical protein
LYKPRKQKDRDGILWFIGLTVIGSLAGYSTAARAGGDGRGNMAIVGAALGAFVGGVALMEVAGTPLATRRWIGAGAGIAAACVSAFVQHWTALPTLIAGVVGGITGAFGHRWVKGVNFFP